MPSNRKRSGFSKRRDKKKKRATGKVIAADDAGAYFEIETILDYRKVKGVNQFLIKWVDYDEPTWEFEEVLCDSAHALAMSLMQTKNDSEFLTNTTNAMETDELGFDELVDEKVEEVIADSVEEEVYEVDVESEQIGDISLAEELDCIQDVEDTTVDWADTSLIEYRPIERVSVHADGVAQLVKAAREAGVPLCLVGHVGWAQFAKPWLSKVPKDDENTYTDKLGDAIQPRSFQSAHTDIEQREHVTVRPEEKPLVPNGIIGEVHKVAKLQHDRQTFDLTEHMDRKHLDAPTENVVTGQSMVAGTERNALPSAEFTATSQPIAPITEQTRPEIDSYHITNSEADQFKTSIESGTTVQSAIILVDPEDRDLVPGGERSATAVVQHTSHVSYIQHLPHSAQSKAQTCAVSPPADGNLLDLSDSHVLDVQKMIDDIGNESVPIQRKSDKLGDDPNQNRVSLKLFIEKCWPEPGKELASAMAARYLHQWQFPLSETAVPKLCNKCNPLPNGILGMDLLRLWHDREQFLGDSPYQYVFMGNKGTMSKLHSDRGGLMITIAPIVGEKEVVLVHRSDGSTSLYDLEGDLDKADLHHYPLLPTARLWKTVVKPGEILIIPHSTYHRCRNLTPCLSYSRFYLDNVNMKAFLQSFIDRDALDVDHEDLLWNVCFELHSELTNYSDGVRRKWMVDGAVEEVPPSVVEIVSTLKKLRNAARHVEIHFIQVANMSHVHWKKMVLDIDNALHNYRYRYYRKQPRVPRKMCRHTKELKREEAPTLTLSEGKAPLNCPLNLYCNQEKISPENEGAVLCDSVALQLGDHVGIKDHGYYFKGVIKEVKNELKAAYVKFTDLSDKCSQYVPFQYLRSDVSDEALAPTFTPLIGSSVYYRESGRSYQARIQSWRCGTLYKLTIKLDQGQYFDRWFTRESFLSKLSKVDDAQLHIV